MASISDPAIRAFLSHGTRTGKLGFTARDGRPLVAPIWFLLAGEGDDTEILFNTGSDTAKGKAIARDPRLVLCVDLEEPPFAFLEVQGIAEVTEDPDELLSSSTALGARYMGAERAEEFGRRNAVPGELLVRLRPTKVVASLDMTS
jgi:PPOX class probable F420-dependent enzyme